MIKLNNISKTYEIRKKVEGEKFSLLKNLFSRKVIKIEAVKDLSLFINEGEVVGYIGTNGAGKSTTIKMMTGILNPSGGNIEVNGFDPFKDRINYVKDIGVIFGQKSQLFWDIPVIESFKLLKKIYNISDEDYQERLAYFTEKLSLKEIMLQSVRQLSLGQKMRAEFAAAFLHNPSVVFLDEPTIGLDINIKYQIRSFIKEMNTKFKTTILLTTHDLQDIESLCNRVIIINKGNKVFDGPLDDIYDTFDTKKTIKITHDSQQIIKLDSEFTDVVKVLKSKDRLSSEITFKSDSVETIRLITSLIKMNDIRDLSIKSSTIEDIIHSMYKV